MACGTARTRSATPRTRSRAHASTRGTTPRASPRLAPRRCLGSNPSSCGAQAASACPGERWRHQLMDTEGWVRVGRSFFGRALCVPASRFGHVRRLYCSPCCIVPGLLVAWHASKRAFSECKYCTRKRFEVSRSVLVVCHVIFRPLEFQSRPSKEPRSGGEGTAPA